MPAKILEGKKIAEKILDAAQEDVALLKQKGIVPKLVVLQVGDDPASTIYVNKKHETCLKIGMESEVKRFDDTISYESFLIEIGKLNKDPKVHGILVQVPLPEQLRHHQLFETIDVKKDVDGFHPMNHGKNFLGKKGFVPATPLGIMELLRHTKVKLEGKYAVVIGRSNIVGKPIALMLINAGCTVTVCNSKTPDLAKCARNADILISAVGKPGLVTAGMIKQGAIVIDAGTTRTKNGIEGDVDFEGALKKASWVTPVPGGVGPMTIASL
ncbi:MAG: bifunctional 5,10-methylenetetrahydrofolate dehydrogenase/5,10-methenyltetrahydrofolate cyclohydrolase, partial [archaeon]|nr:bifunctional 5,10-methylenetetrahydrofolate dehydrogenase/5,10-methenyltetrahydrofolate cyclohydrolase [archaeon]